MVRYLSLFGSFLTVLGITLKSIFGVFYLLIGKIEVSQYYLVKHLEYSVTPVSLGQIFIYFGTILILLSTMRNTNIFMILGSIFLSIAFSWSVLSEIRNLTWNNPLPPMIATMLLLVQISFFVGFGLSIIGYLQYHKVSPTLTSLGLGFLLLPLLIVIINIATTPDEICLCNFNGLHYTITQEVEGMIYHVPFIFLGLSWSFLNQKALLRVDQANLGKQNHSKKASKI